MMVDGQSGSGGALRRRVLLAGVLSAVAGGALLHAHERRLRREVSGGEPVAVLAVTRDLAVGERVGRDALAVRAVPEAYVGKRVIRASDADRIVGVRTSLGVESGEVLSWADLAIETERGRTLARLVPAGMRAVSIRARAFEGLLRPGDRVDVLFTVAEGAGRGGSSTGTLLQKVLVLAVGGSTVAGAEGTAGLGEVTLSATVEQAQALAQAEGRGHLDLVLRHPDDIVVVDGVPEVSADDLLSAERRVAWRRSETEASHAR